MIWLYATFVSALVFGLGGFLLKVGSHKNYAEASMLLGLYLSGTVILFVALLIYGNVTFDRTILMFSIIVGLGSYYGNYFLVKAYDQGPASLTAPLMSISIVLVILLSSLIYDENISNWQYFGIALMVSAAALLGFNFKNTSIKSPLWIIFVMLGILFLFMREGGLKIAHENGLDNLGILFFSYTFASVLALLTFSKSSSEVSINHNQALLLGTVIGVLSAVGMGLLAFAIANGPAAVIVPLFSGRNIITVLLIVVFFKEKLTSIQWASIGLMVTGILLIY